MIPLLVSMSWALGPPAAEAFSVQSTTVRWGAVPVIYSPSRDAHEITAQWIFDVGAADDPPGHAGRAHLVEHLSFGELSPIVSPFGVEDARGWDYDDALGRIGGESEGWTDRDRSGVGATVPVLSDHGWDEILALMEVETGRVLADAPTDDAVAAQLRIIRLEAMELVERAHGLDRIWLDQLLWSPGAPWSRHPQAMPELDEQTAAASRADLAARFRPAQPARGVLVVAGRLPAGLIEALPPAVPEAAPESPPSDASERCDPSPPTRAWRRADVAEGAIYFAWPTVPRTHPDRIPLEAIARWMGGARVASGRDCGAFVVERRGGWWRLGEHARALNRSLDGLARSGLPTHEIDRLRMGQLTDLARGLASLPVRARLIGSCHLTTGRADCLPDEARAWIALDPEHVRRAAARWLEWDTVTLLAVVPPDTALAPPIAGIRER